MATLKRKRHSAESKSKKRSKYADSSDDEHEHLTSPAVSEQEWAAECILDERFVRNKLQYLIKWDGFDPRTGEAYPPTWEPKANANAILLASWAEEKAQRKTSSSHIISDEAQSERKRHAQKKHHAWKVPRRVLNSHIIESSPDPSSGPSRVSTSTPAREDTAVGRVSSTATTPTGAPLTKPPSPRIQTGRRGSSLDREDFNFISQVVQSQSAQSQSQPPSRAQNTDLDSSLLFAAVPKKRLAGVIVADSQSSAGEASFVAPTQDTTGTTPETTQTSESQDAAEDSGLLEIVEEAARALSPARSIPETVYDTTTESQPQHRQDSGQEPVEIPESLDIILSSSQADEPNPHNRAAPFFAQAGSARDSVTDPLGAETSVLEQSSLTSQPQSSHLQTKNSPEIASREVANNSCGSVTLDVQSGGAEVAQAGDDDPAVCQASCRDASLADHSFQHQTIHPLDLHHPSHNSALIVNSSDRNSPRTELQKDVTEQRVCAADSHPSTESHQQYAQSVLTEAALCSQEDSDQVILPSIEHNSIAARSRVKWHDSSQESLEHQPHSDRSSSAVPHPPSHSLTTRFSNLPPRPKSPLSISNTPRMASSAGDDMVQRMRDEIAKRQAENPFVPPKRGRMQHSSPSASQAAPADRVGRTPTQFSSRRLLRTGAPPSTTTLDGTRSPSSVPDRSPAPPAPTSLRTVALSQSSQVPADETLQETAKASNPEPETPEPARDVATIMPTIVTSGPAVPAVGSSSDDEEQLNDADDDDDDDESSLLNDDLDLGYEEYVIPIVIEGRQSDSYAAEIKHKKELLEGFLQNPHDPESLAAVEEVLDKLRAIETHYDLVYAEANPPLGESVPMTQAEHMAQFGIENSAKFKFLDVLFTALWQQKLHIVLLLENDDDALFNIIETYCFAKRICYDMPTRGRTSSSNHARSDLHVTIFQSSASPVIKPVDIIICLDGVQYANVVRKKDWARQAEQALIPIFHLIIPRTVGHIERYVSTSLNKTERIHTILATLAQVRGELGIPLDDDTVRPGEAAEQVAEWFDVDPANRNMWPLRTIGSVKNIIEYQTQISQAVTPPPERTKRPHDDEELDSSKRMRLTPQPSDAASSSLPTNTHDTTRISDSMPRTAIDKQLPLQPQVSHWESAYRRERALRQAEKERFGEQEIQWDKQQTKHEDLTKEYRLLLGKQERTEELLEKTRQSNETLRNRLSIREVELQALRDQLKELRAINLMSDDARIVEITKLRKDLADAREEKARAVKNAETADSMAEYTKEQYRLAQELASSSQSAVADLEAQNAKLQHQASAQPAKLKALHLHNQFENQATQIRALRAETSILKKSLAQKEDDLHRAKMSGRMGVGTRATSATPQPKVRSRAGSPMGGRLSNLRNG